MGDQGLRELESKWRSSGALEDEAAWLSARVAKGHLQGSRLSLAAWLGHPAAREAADEPPGFYSDLIWWEEKEFRQAGDYLARYGSEAMTRVLLASCWARPRTHRLTKSGPRRRALSLVEAALVGVREDPPALRAFLDRSRPKARAQQSGPAWDRACERHQSDLLSRLVEFHLDPSPTALRAAWEADGLDLDSQEEARQEVAPWALGYSDPLRLRVEARQRGAACE